MSCKGLSKVMRYMTHVFRIYKSLLQVKNDIEPKISKIHLTANTRNIILILFSKDLFVKFLLIMNLAIFQTTVNFAVRFSNEIVCYYKARVLSSTHSRKQCFFI